MDSTLIGRFAELAQLSGALKDTLSGRSQAVFIEGDAGLGKTALLDELAADATARGATVIRARAHELERSLPFAPLTRAVERFLSDQGDLSSLVREDCSDLAVIVPSLASTPRSVGPDARVHAYVLLARVLEHLSRRDAIALILDDLHWADDATVEVVQVLVDRLHSTRCLVAAAYRNRPPDLAEETAVLLDTVVHRGDAVRIRLSGLDSSDVSALAGSLLGGHVSTRLASYVFDATRGNPLFVGELTESLRQSSDLVEADGRWDLSQRAAAREHLPAPAGAKAAVFHRIWALGDDARLVARAVSVLGRLEFSSPTQDAVADLAGFGSTRLARAMDALLRAGILQQDERDGLVFNHPLVRSMLYDDVGPAEKRSLHERVAAALTAAREAGADVDVAQLAVHVSLAARPGDASAVELLIEAGDTMVHRAPSVAAEWFERALALIGQLDDDRLHHQLLARRATALFLCDRITEAATAAEEVWRFTGDGRQRSAAASLRITALTAMGALREALREADRALEQVQDAGRFRLLAHRVSVMLYLGDLDAAERAAAEAWEAGERDLPAEVLLLREQAQIALLRGNLDEEARLSSEALRAADPLPASTRGIVLALSGVRRATVGDLSRARQRLMEANDLCSQFGAKGFQPIVDLGLSVADWLSGDWDSVLARTSVVLAEHDRSGRLLTFSDVWPFVIAIGVDRGDVAEARRKLAPLLGPENLDRLDSVWVQWCEAHLLRMTGKHEEAIQRLILLRPRLERIPGGGAAFVLDELSEAANDAGDQALARSVLASLDVLALQLSTPLTRGLLARARLRIDGDVTAGHHAHELLTEVGLPFEVAKTALMLGGATGDRSLLEEAHHTFTRLDAAPWLRRTRVALRDIGVQPAATRRRTSAELTDLEGKMARLVADGLSNKEIAASLALSVKTVENYLTRMYAKTGHRSRTELASAVASGGLIVR